MLPSKLDLRLLMTTDAVGGVWTYTLDLARGLAAHGVATTLAVLGPNPTQAQLDQAALAEDLRVVETGLELDWRAAKVAEIADTAERVAEIARQHAADVVQLNTPSLAALARFEAPVIGVCHSCSATWWEATQPAGLPESMRWQKDLLGRGYARCNRLVAPSVAFAAATARQYGVRPDVVHNGRDCGRPDHLPRDRCVLTAGRLWDKGKNVAALDRVAGLIDAPLYAAGDVHMPPGGTVSLRHAEKLGRLREDELLARMARSPVFASLAVYEPFGLTVLEAAQCGCALVLSDIASFRELWSGAAMFVSPYDVEGCAAIIGGLLDDPASAAAWGAAARARAALYDAGSMVRGMLGHYRALLSSMEAIN